MRAKFSIKLISTLITAVLSPFALAEAQGASNSNIERITIFGSSSLNQVPGSGHRLSQEELEAFDYSDIMRTLTSVPGVYVLEEDGYGLRPNIGMRGTGQNRSEKVTIMEDNVLAAPAPYAAPSAYYFPTSGRMQQIEVLKGTSSAIYGPRTTGGVINMLSRQVPSEPLAGLISMQSGQDGYRQLHGVVGARGDAIGGLLEAYRYQADGFKDITHSNQDTGFVKNDLLAKINYQFDFGFEQFIELKLKYSDESSNETYMGLTEDDFQTSPFSRYSASQKDTMNTKHNQIQINHVIDLTPSTAMSTSAYYNEFSRNWYKVSKINGVSLGRGGIKLAADFDKDSGTALLRVDVKANNRDYISRGAQTILDTDLDTHQVSAGIRIHEDEMDRFQWVDNYQLDSKYAMTLLSAGIPGTDSNRIDSAQAIAVFIHDEWSLDNTVIHAGLRYEDMQITRDDWGKQDPERLRAPNHKSNKLDVVLPSLAFTHLLTDNLVVIGGVQKGFAPPAPGNAQAEHEQSVNYEIGARYTNQKLSTEALLFFSDYENMHGNCTASQNCDDENIGQQYNAGEVSAAGLEIKITNEFNLANINTHIDLAYTYSQTEFLTSFDSDFWGQVSKGDELPYVPSQQLQLTFGLEGDFWSSNLLIRHSNEIRTKAGQGQGEAEEAIKAKSIIDWVTRLKFDAKHEVKLSIDNVLDEIYMASRTHGSIMVGKPRSITLGYKFSF